MHKKNQLETASISASQKPEYSSMTSKLCSFFNPPSSRGRSDELTHSSPWGLSIDTDFEDCEPPDDGYAYSSTSSLCAALGLSSPNSPRSPTSPSFKSFAFDTPRHGLNEIHPTPDVPEHSVEHNTTGKGPTVFVWDLDETLIIFQTLIDGRYVELFDGFKDSHKATAIGRRWERLILEVCDDHFFYSHVEEYNHSNVDSLKEYDDGADLGDYKFEDNNLQSPLTGDNLRNLSHLYRYISQLYEQGLETLLSPEQAKEWDDLYEATDAFTDGWLSAGRQKIEELQRMNEQALQDEFQATSNGNDQSVGLRATPPNAYNFLVTSGTLIPSLVKCLLFKLRPYFNPSNIFSSREVGKLQSCRWIHDRFMQRDNFPKFCAIGDGPDEKEAAHVLAWPFVKISIDPDAPNQLPLLSCKTVEEQMKTVYRIFDTSKG